MSKLHAIDKPIFRFWNALYMAFYSRRFYIDVCKRWRGFGLRYLFLLIFIASIPLSLRILVGFNTYFNEQIIDPLTHLPDIYVQNGKASIDKPMPYLVRNKAHEVVAVIDTNATYEEMFKFYPKLSILITESMFYFKPPQLRLFQMAGMTDSAKDKTFEHPIAEMSDSVFNGKDWLAISGVTKLQQYTDLLIFPAIAIFFFAMYLVVMFGVVLLAQGFSWVIFKLKLKYKEAARLCSTAITAQVMLFFTVLTLEIKFPGLGSLQVALFAVYFSYAALAVKRERKSLVFA